MWIFSSRRSRWRRRLRHFIKQVKYLSHIDDDIYPEEVKDKVDGLLREADDIDPDEREKVEAFLDSAPERLGAILPRRPHQTIREYADILAVSLCVAFGVRALFLQPFKIPTSSMQPSLFGIHYVQDRDATPMERLPFYANTMLLLAQRAKLEIRDGGELNLDSFRTYARFMLLTRTDFVIGGHLYTLPGERAKVMEYALGKRRQNHFESGELVCDGWLSLGDHLFVDRYTFNFREPRRGEIIVFNTEDIMYGGEPLVNRGYYYIKRLVGLPGDTLRIAEGQLYVKPADSDKEVPITKISAAFEKIYSGYGGYHGHLNYSGDAIEGAFFLPDQHTTYTVPENSYFVLGDNSRASFDSRYWGSVPRRNLVGRGFFVFAPFSRRWGFVDWAGPMEVPSDAYGVNPMELQ